jgi:uncharacterized SAM-binding protein YcdF (DUF218 family)
MLMLVCGALAWWATSIADFLRAGDVPRRVDAIVVLGADPTRVLEGADLFRAGHAPRVLLSQPTREKRLEAMEAAGVAVPWFEVAGRELLRRRGVPDAAVATFGQRLKSTVEEAQSIAREHPELKAILVVSSPYHVHRSRRIFRDHLPGVEVLGVGSRYEEFPAAWWRDQESARHAIMETLKLVFYLAGGRM